MPKQYIKLPKLNGQKVRKKYYVSSAIRHPAKGNIPMMIWILERFVEEGDIVLDPMAGIGTTLLEGMRLFPNSLFIGVELEEKFIKWCNASIKKIERIAKEDWFMKVGKAICVQGDARELEKVLKEKVNKIISSPPYSETIKKSKKGSDITAQRDKWAKLMEERDKLLNRNWGKNRRTEGRLKAIETMLSGYSRNPKNIGNLPHGQADKIITSPPFGQAQFGGGIAKKGYTGNKHSPTDLVGKRAYMPENTGQDKKNISNLPYVDKVISSPPYEQTASPHARGTPLSKDKGTKIGCHNIAEGYIKNKQNIGNLKQQTYLQAMYLVYCQCFRVLKDGGLMILILKDFVRKGRRIPLGEHTIKLCEMAGFKHFHTYYRKIENPSFWRILYQQKYPEVEQIDCEDILVFKKVR